MNISWYLTAIVLWERRYLNSQTWLSISPPNYSTSLVNILLQQKLWHKLYFVRIVINMVCSHGADNRRYMSSKFSLISWYKYIYYYFFPFISWTQNNLWSFDYRTRCFPFILWCGLTIVVYILQNWLLFRGNGWELFLFKSFERIANTFK